MTIILLSRMKSLKNLLSRGISVFLSSFFLVRSSFALAADSASRNNLAGAKEASTLTGDATQVPQYVGGIIALILSLLGIVFLLLIVRAGFLWMTAQGDQKAITKAKDILIQSTIGLLITLSAYAISAFVVSSLTIATGGVGVL